MARFTQGSRLERKTRAAVTSESDRTSLQLPRRGRDSQSNREARPNQTEFSVQKTRLEQALYHLIVFAGTFGASYGASEFAQQSMHESDPVFVFLISMLCSVMIMAGEEMYQVARLKQEVDIPLSRWGNAIFAGLAAGWASIDGNASAGVVIPTMLENTAQSLQHLFSTGAAPTETAAQQAPAMVQEAASVPESIPTILDDISKFARESLTQQEIFFQAEQARKRSELALSGLKIGGFTLLSGGVFVSALTMVGEAYLRTLKPLYQKIGNLRGKSHAAVVSSRMILHGEIPSTTSVETITDTNLVRVFNDIEANNNNPEDVYTALLTHIRSGNRVQYDFSTHQVIFDNQHPQPPKW